MRQLAALITALALSPTAARAADGLPPFNWEHVPVYAQRRQVFGRLHA